MMSKLFASFPIAAGGDAGVRLAAYLLETQRVPIVVLSHALAQLVRTRKSPYAPSVYEILRESALVLRRWHAEAEGRDPSEYNPRAEPGETELDIERWLALAPAVLDRRATGQRRLEAKTKVTNEERTLGAKRFNELMAARKRKPS